MYMEVVKEIRKLEEQVEQSKAQARAQAKDSLDAVEKEGHALLADTRQTIREADAAAMKTCEEQAAARRQDVLRQAEEQCRQLREQAAGRMDEAVARIVGRVVGR
jgi:vacuolar-type H+-ATPase subunit H